MARIPAIVFDTETTGFTAAEIIEAAYLELGTDPMAEVTGSFLSQYKPSKAIEVGAMSVHHIVDADLYGCQPSSTFVFPEVEYVVGHKVDYDMDLVKFAEGAQQPKRICTLALCRHLYPEAGTHTLSAMVYYLKGPQGREMLRDAHSALADVTNCLYVLQEIATANNLRTWEELYTLSELARIPRIMAFGKWKGTPIAEVPRDYVMWYLKQDEKDPYLEKAFRARMIK